MRIDTYNDSHWPEVHDLFKREWPNHPEVLNKERFDHYYSDKYVVMHNNKVIAFVSMIPVYLASTYLINSATWITLFTIDKSDRSAQLKAAQLMTKELFCKDNGIVKLGFGLVPGIDIFWKKRGHYASFDHMTANIYPINSFRMAKYANKNIFQAIGASIISWPFHLLSHRRSSKVVKAGMDELQLSSTHALISNLYTRSHINSSIIHHPTFYKELFSAEDRYYRVYFSIENGKRVAYSIYRIATHPIKKMNVARLVEFGGPNQYLEDHLHNAAIWGRNDFCDAVVWIAPKKQKNIALKCGYWLQQPLGIMCSSPSLVENGVDWTGADADFERLW